MDIAALIKSSKPRFPSRLFAQPFRIFLILLFASQLLMQTAEAVTIAWASNPEPNIVGYRV